MLHSRKTTTWRADIYDVAGPVRLGSREPELYLSIIGRFFSTGRFEYQQVASGHALHVVESGRGVMEVGGKSYMVEAGDGFGFFPGCHYHYYDAPTTPWRYAWLILEGSQAEAVLAHVGITRAAPKLSGDIARRMSGLLQKLCVVYQRPVISPIYAAAAAWQVVDVLAAAKAGGDEPRSVAETARLLMDREAMDFLAVADLAEHLGVSRSALFRHFRDAYGISPKEYLDAARIGRAQRLLEQSQSPLKQIAGACGYASSQYFIRAFRKHCGVSPGRWRRTARRQHDRLARR